MTFVDTNVLLDLVTDDPVWANWSVERLETLSLVGPLLINAVIYAELAVRYDSMERLELFVTEAGLEIVEIPRSALFLAAKAFGRYRGHGGSRTGVLPDFFIGAHAVVEGYPLLTRDKGRFQSYFPALELIAP